MKQDPIERKGSRGRRGSENEEHLWSGRTKHDNIPQDGNFAVNLLINNLLTEQWTRSTLRVVHTNY